HRRRRGPRHAVSRRRGAGRALAPARGRGSSLADRKEERGGSMSILKEAGKRSIQVEIEVPGTPEEVWQAIATGNGFTAWFTRGEIEEREGGTVTHYMGGGESKGVVTAWQPPHRFATEAPNYM